MSRLARLLFATTILMLPLARSASAADVQRVVSPGGIEAWLIEDHMVPVLSVRFAFRGGAALDPPEKQGLANMVSALIDEGAGDLDSQAFQKLLADLSINLRFDAGRDWFGGSLNTLTENRDEAVRLLALALTEPRFDEEPVGRIREQILLNLARRSVDPNHIAYRTWFELVFDGHPYARPTEGTADTVQAIAADDLRRFVRTRLATGNLLVGVAGDIKAAELGPLLDRAFGKLPREAAVGDVPPAKIVNPGATVVIERPVPQSVAVFGEGGLLRADPDWYAAQVVNYVLGGGGFTSRLTEEVREKRGLAYSIATWLNPFLEAGLIMGQVATQNDRVAESLALIRAEWARVAAEGLTEEEIRNAKTYLIGSFPISLDSTGNIAGTLLAMQQNTLGIDYLERRKALIEAVTTIDVRRVAKRLLDASALVFVVVGQPANVSATRPAPKPG